MARCGDFLLEAVVLPPPLTKGGGVPFGRKWEAPSALKVRTGNSWVSEQLTEGVGGS